MVKAGQAFRLALAQPITSAQAIKPDGTRKNLIIDADSRELVFGDTVQTGIYRIQAGTNNVTFCVNLMDPTESNIAPPEEISLGKYAKVSAATIKRANLELWRWIAAAAFLVLLFEWWYYHKRTA